MRPIQPEPVERFTPIQKIMLGCGVVYLGLAVSGAVMVFDPSIGMGLGACVAVASLLTLFIGLGVQVWRDG